MPTADLCAALPGLADCGPDLVFSPDFDTIARLREEEDPALAQGEWRRPPRQADWPAVMRDTEALLRSRSKDLRLAGWWAEAAAHTQGPAGLADGLELAAALCERWWPGLHPRADDDEADARVGALRWLLARSASLAGSAPLLQLGRRPIALADIAAARRRPDADGGADVGGATVVPNGAAAPAGVLAAVAAAGPAAFTEHAAAMERALAALGRLQAVCDRELGAHSPSFAAAGEALEQATAELKRLAGVDAVAVTTPGPNDVQAACSTVAGHGTPTLATGVQARPSPDNGPPVAARHRAADGTPADLALMEHPANGTSTGTGTIAYTNAGTGTATEAGTDRGTGHSPGIGTAAAATAGCGTTAEYLACTGPAGRAEAIAQLRAVASYFHRVEPHNPAAYLADKAARWAELPLHAWLREVLAEDSTLARLEQALDLTRRAGDSGG
ncbi:hypothetical protein CKO44_20960 [Rubrivivax gelatinosus]|uniref:ImpA N-terminal domain-containing protein n=1 Tax=Rubrivivax gelatinosus TaxID=28068 RepID=A0ABS1DYX0_RUBGE|nr:type VI secretion system protein TssA [Rubrivivax gelatinosus]MBK1615927.1 hypothetical protein [Rubrivivax gelatinosus]MBK1714944.1 hypothetical protein [Rubrivivax gelatinosus]